MGTTAIPRSDNPECHVNDLGKIQGARTEMKTEEVHPIVADERVYQRIR